MRARPLLLLAALTLLLSAGCVRDSPAGPSSVPAARQHAPGASATSGRRLAVVDPDGRTVHKLRLRKNAWKVYDDALVAAGYVRFRDTTVSMHPLTGGAPTPLVAADSASGSADVFELGDALRIERASRGWVVFDADAKLLGVFEQTDDDVASWTLRTSYGVDARWHARREDTPTGARLVVTRPDGQTLTASPAATPRHATSRAHGALNTAALLAFELPGVPALERAALAAWFVHAMPDDAGSPNDDTPDDTPADAYDDTPDDLPGGEFPEDDIPDDLSAD